VSKRVLVTGAGGFVGSHLVQSLLGCDWELVTIDSFRHNGATDRLLLALTTYGAPPTSVSVVVHDLAAPFSPRQAARLGHVDVILDVASRSSVDESIDDPANFIFHNVAVTVNTLELARRIEPTTYVHLSTDEVYGSDAPPASDTDHRPSSPYAASKSAQEDVCHAYARTYDVPVTIATGANMFGERQSQLAFIPKIVKAVLRDEVVTIHTSREVPGERVYNYVGDVTDWLVELVAEYEPNEWPDHVAFAGRYRLDNLTLARDVAHLVGELTGQRRPLRHRLVEGSTVRPGYDRHYHDLPHDDAWLHPDNLANAPLDERLLRTVEWFVAHPDWLEE
jgi:dTDP-glucose 4,6-dehydratase